MKQKHLKIISFILFSILPLARIFSQNLTDSLDKSLLTALQKETKKDFSCSIKDIKVVEIIESGNHYSDKFRQMISHGIYKMEGCNKIANYYCEEDMFIDVCERRGDIGNKLEKDAKKAKKIEEAEVLRQAEIKKVMDERLAFQKRLTSKPTIGKFGGGYQEAKWGMSHTEVSALYEKNGEIKFDEDKAVLNVKTEKVMIDFYFYRDSLFKVNVRTDTNSKDNIVSLENKFGKPINITRYNDEDWNSEGFHFEWQRFAYIWSDGNTQINTQSCEALNQTATLGCGWNLKFDKTVVFIGTIIDTAIKQDQDEAAKASAIEKNKGNF
jgi:hypothetical protein